MPDDERALDAQPIEDTGRVHRQVGDRVRVDRFRRVGRYDLVFRLEENRWNGTVAPQLVVRRIFDEAPRYEELRDRLIASWRAGEESWDEQTRTIFAEAGLLEEDAGRRNLLESETFRALLAEGEPAVAAA